MGIIKSPLLFSDNVILLKYMIITTPSGYEVELKDKLNFGEMRELQKVLFTGLKSEVGKSPEIELSRLLEYSEKAFPILVKKITKNGVEVTGNLLDEVNKWDNEDGQAAFDKITEIALPAKKN